MYTPHVKSNLSTIFDVRNCSVIFAIGFYLWCDAFKKNTRKKKCHSSFCMFCPYEACDGYWDCVTYGTQELCTAPKPRRVVYQGGTQPHRKRKEPRLDIRLPFIQQNGVMGKYVLSSLWSTRPPSLPLYISLGSRTRASPPGRANLTRTWPPRSALYIWRNPPTPFPPQARENKINKKNKNKKVA